MPNDVQVLADQIFIAVKTYLAQRLTPMKDKQGELESQITELRAAFPTVRNGIDGKDGATGQRGADGKEGPPGPPGKDGEKGADGKDGKDGEPGIQGAQGPVGKDGRDGVDGKDGANGKDGASVDLVELSQTIDSLVAEHVALIPPPKDGIAGKDGVDGRDGRDGAIGPAGKDALHIEPLQAVEVSKSYPRGTYIIHAGGMIRSFRTTDPLESKSNLEEAGWSVVMNGVAGETEIVEDDERTHVRTTTYTNGSTYVRKFKTRMQIHRGVWRERSYYAGDTVTWGGSMFHCDKDATTEKPGSGSTDWHLCTKRGSDGKDGERGERGPMGPAGNSMMGGSRRV